MESIWTKSVNREKLINNENIHSHLTKDLKTEVAVIGAGMAGILTAFKLSQAGKKVIVIEADKIASGQTKNTTAKITVSHNIIYDSLILEHGIDKARQYAIANQRAIKQYEDIIRDNDIQCDFKTLSSYLYSIKQRDILELEAIAAKKLGLNAEFTRECELPFEISGAVRYDGQAQFNPLKFIYALADKLTIYEDTMALDVEENVIRTKDADITADSIVFATHFPFINSTGYYFMRMHQQRSYVLALENAAVYENMYLGIDPDFNYSFRNYKDYLIFGGSGHRTGENKNGGQYDGLKLKAEELYKNCKPVAWWSAQDCVALDNIPYIGRYSETSQNWFVTTGFRKWGMTSSMVSANIITDMILEKDEPYHEIFSPQRFNILFSLNKVISEGAKSTKNLLKEKFSFPKTEIDKLPAGHGGIVEYNGEKIGVYKNDEGEAFLVTVKCPHLGCQLEWNPDELSWDCPCHGSRFDYKGRLLTNPAMEGIEIDE